MFIALAITTVYVALIWLVFFRLKWLRFSVGWGVVSAMVGLHVILIFLIGMRFVAPGSYRAVVVQHTVQLIPRLTDPTVLTEVLVTDNVPVRKGQPLFKFDPTLYALRVQQLEAQLEAARQNARILTTNVEIAVQRAAKLKTELDYELFQKGIFDKLAREQAAREDDIQKWQSRVNGAEAAHLAAVGELDAARQLAEAQINGVNTAVADIQAQLGQARYYLSHTTIVAPADGRIVNLQARPGMVVGIVRIGAIAALVVDDDRYVLGLFRQENLKYVKGGQSVEIAIDLYPGQIFKGRVDSIWWGTGQGQMLPTADLPVFTAQGERMAEGLFAVKIHLDAVDQLQFPIGAQGIAAIYTGGGGFAALRRVAIRAYSWANWLYPLQ
ncbi:HlyD family secretion protein [Bosea sp. 2KB_26]|uniref:HlyD family secretion protein n=1 Tax=Bosea sp. 2KB_26 TaxID=3237475 RepID=UPI000DE2857B